MKKALLLSTILACSSFGFSQTFSIKGNVLDQEQNPIAFANVLLLKASDSSFIKGTSASELGDFVLEDISPKKYLVQASYIGKSSQLVAIDLQGDLKLEALMISLAAEQLDEVVVAATQPKIERLQDRLVFNVENTVVATGDSWNVLRNTPGVIMNGESLEIRGTAATIYLNNRRVQLSGDELKTLLEGFSGANIKSVEVIPNPPASYDAEGGPVLNIITSKNLVAGYKGSVNGSLTQAVFPKYSLGTSHYFKTEKLNVFANYSFNPKKELRKTSKGVNFMDNDGNIFSDWDTQIQEIKKTASHNATAIIDYTFDDKNSLNFTSTYINNPNQDENRRLQTLITNGAGVLDSSFTTSSFLAADNTNLAIDLTFGHSFDSGATLTTNAHYTDYNYTFNQDLGSAYFDAAGNFSRNFAFQTVSNQNIDIYTAQLDYAQPTESGLFETGIKASIIDSESSILFQNFEGVDEFVNQGLTDDFLYDESVFAGYVSWSKSWEKWSIKTGLRGEYTDALGTSLTLGTVNEQEFFEVFPSVYALYTLSERHSFAFDYRRGIYRPKYNDLNPFRIFTNENDFLEGNAGLRPSFDNNFNLNYTYNDEWFFDVYYRDNGELVGDIVFQDNQNLILRELRQNWQSSTSYGLDVTFSKSILDPWYLYSYISFFHEDVGFLAEESGNVPFEIAVDGFYAYLANYLTLSKDGTFTGQVGLTYLSQFLFGSYVQDEQLNLTLGLRKTLWNNRAVISLAAEDILERYIPTYTSSYLNQDNFYRRRPELQFVRLGFTYNFGNFRLSDNKRAIEKKERDRLENN